MSEKETPIIGSYEAQSQQIYNTNTGNVADKNEVIRGQASEETLHSNQRKHTGKKHRLNRPIETPSAMWFKNKHHRFLLHLLVLIQQGPSNHLETIHGPI